MTIARRLSRLESSLPPKAAVLHWLDEAHAFPTASAYVAWLLSQPRDTYPLVGIPKRVEQAARDAARGRNDAERTVRDAVSDTVFLVHLALGIVSTIEEALHVAGLRSVALMWWMRALSCPEADAPGETSGWPAWREVAHLHVAELRELDTAVGSIADRYFDGRDCLFPTTRTEWTDLRGRAEALLGVGEEMASSARGAESETDVRVAAATDRAGTLVAHARVEAMDAVGRPEAAMAVVEQDLRVRMGVA